jgi:hypothetical protein
MHETSSGSAGAPDREGFSGRGGGEQSPLQTRASFLKNWSWEFVVRANRAACERGCAQHGFNSEAGKACSIRWEEKRSEDQTLTELFDLLREFHRAAPFLFFNGNTFADIARTICSALFADLPAIRRREVVSAVAHYVAGVLDRNSTISIVESLCQSATLEPGDRVQTLRGSTSGIITRLLDDGRVAWRPDSAKVDLLALPESLRRIS